MVLNTSRIPRRSESGLTMVELMVAVALSGVVAALAMALFKDVGSALYRAQGRERETFQDQALFSALSENLIAGGGILRLAPGELDLLNRSGQKVAYKWEDSTLTINGKAWSMRVSEFKLEPAGPSLLVREGMDWRRIADPALDTLDGNRDGLIDAEELDRDRNGILETWECRYISQIRITFTTLLKGLPVTQTCLIHPRNHAQSQSLADFAPGTRFF